ncbi:cation-translocating P-type ATPase [Hoeflea alexandrii]|uniref:HAD-IC family P-type ATPase n=2 Tax=Hoeflea alexandrii TaxID=288436 RepID=A0ABT1CXY6_9HYPH|nr:HAD-IC family P-type ATPase [Hoeflea alexandrii]
MTLVATSQIMQESGSTQPTTTGLTTEEATLRLQSHGRNAADSGREETFLEELLESLREPLVLLLLAVGGLYFFFGETRDALIVLGVVVAVALTETMIEWRAGKAIAALTAMSDPMALVWRDGDLGDVAVEDLVPGDLLDLRAGVRIGADARLVRAHGLAVDESLVTGEAEPVGHGAETPDLLGGTLVVRGSGQAVVTQTGMASTLGRIAELVAGAKEPKTPMQRQMGELARVLLWVALSVSAIIPMIGIALGQPPKEMLLTGLSLAFATIPEELAVMIVIVLGLGSLKLARRGAIVRQLRAAETLGAVTTICTDKTGTLTQNRMTVLEWFSASALIGEGTGDVRSLMEAAGLASGDTKFEPMDAAILSAANMPPPVDFYPFDQSLRLATGVSPQDDGGFAIGTKGAVEAVLANCETWRRDGQDVPLSDNDRARLSEAVAEAGRRGRILGIASRRAESPPADRDEAERDQTFEGIVILGDPIRPEVAGALAGLHKAGVGVSVITGDQPETARRIAEEVGLVVEHEISGPEIAGMDQHSIAASLAHGAVVARAQPGDKLRIVNALMEAGGVVMMTGDGVNDAPALRAASVGVAMGHAGSDAAREAAGVVLTDDSFATIFEAVRQGRRLYDNFRKAIRFYLAVKLAIIAISAVAAISGHPLPFSPVQIVILELFMDLGAALAFVNQPADSDIMRRPPRDPNAPFFQRELVIDIVLGALTLAAVVLAAFYWMMIQTDNLAEARGAALIAWFAGHVSLGFIMSFDDGRPRLRALIDNPMLLLWIASSLAFAAVLATVPAVAEAVGAKSTGLGTTALFAGAAILAPLLMVFRLRAHPAPHGAGTLSETRK